MGWSAARKLRRVGRRADPGARDRGAHRRPRRSTCARRSSPPPATGAVVAAAAPARRPGPGPDRYLAPEIEAAVELVASGAAVAAVEAVTGALADLGTDRSTDRRRPP